MDARISPPGGDELFRDIVEHAEIAIQVSAPDGRLLYANESWQRLLGYSADDISRGLDLSGLIAPESAAHCGETFSRVLAGKAANGVQAVFVCKNGSRVAVAVDANCRIVDGIPAYTRASIRELESVGSSTPVRRERYDATVATLGDGVAVLDADGVVRAVNPAGETLLGAPARVMIGVRLLDLPWSIVDEQGRPMAKERHPALAALRSGEAVREEVIGFKRTADDVTWLAVTAIPRVGIGEQRPTEVAITFRDVSARKMLQSALAQSERTLDLIFNATNDFIFLVTIEHGDGGVAPVFRFEAANTGYAVMAGVAPRELVGKTIHEALPAERAASAQVMLERTLAEGWTRYNGPARVATGSIVVDALIRVIPATDDTPSRILVVGRDVTEQARRDAEIRLSEERFRAVAASLAEGLVLTDLADTALYVNQRLCELTGFSASEIVGRSLADLVLTPEGRETLRHQMQERAEGKVARYQVQLVRKDGAMLWAEVGGAPFRDASGVIVGTVGTISDITQRVSVEEATAQMIGIVSHELRTPLGALTGALTLLRNALPNLAARPSHLLELATRNAARLLRLVNDLLDLERLEAVSAIERRSIDLTTLIQEASELLGPVAHPRGVQLIADVQAPTLDGDAERMLQVVINLAGNAIKFSPDGATVVIGTRERAGEVELYVRDHGRGIPEDRIHTLFRRFAQIEREDATRHKGAGLGLAISRAIVEQHGGTIRAENAGDGGGGAIFRVLVPTDGAARGALPG